MKTIIIYRHNGAGNMYLGKDGALTSDKSQAAHFWDNQFESVLAENWICHAGGTAGFEYVADKWTSKAERAAIALETGLQPRKLRVALLLLAEQTRRDCAPAIAKLQEIDNFIASGKSLVGWLKEKTTLAELPAWARLQAPPLPVGLPMPPNKCLAPRVNLPAINV